MARIAEDVTNAVVKTIEDPGARLMGSSPDIRTTATGRVVEVYETSDGNVVSIAFSEASENGHMTALGVWHGILMAAVLTFLIFSAIHFNDTDPQFVATTNFLTSTDDDDHVAPDNCPGGSWDDPCPPEYKRFRVFPWILGYSTIIIGISVALLLLYIWHMWLDRMRSGGPRLPEDLTGIRRFFAVGTAYYKYSITHDHEFNLSHGQSVGIGLIIHFILPLLLGAGVSNIYVAVLLSFIYGLSELAGLFMAWSNRRKGFDRGIMSGSHVKHVDFTHTISRLLGWTLVFVIEVIFLARYPFHSRQALMYAAVFLEWFLAFIQAGGLQLIYYLHLDIWVRSRGWFGDEVNGRDTLYVKQNYSEYLNLNYYIPNEGYALVWQLNPIAYEWMNVMFNALRFILFFSLFTALVIDHHYVPLFEPTFPF